MVRPNPNLHSRHGIFYLFWHRDEGKRVEESLRTRDPAVANERYQQRMEEIRKGQSPTDKSAWTLETVTKKWLEHRKLTIARGSYRSEESIVRNLQRVFGPTVRLRSLAEITKLRTYQNQRLKEGAQPKTVNNELMVLKGIFREAHLAHRVSDYKPLRTRKSDIPKALSADELERLVRAAVGASATSVAPFAAVLAVATGMRSREIMQLGLGNIYVDWPQPFIVVSRKTTKTDAGVRRVALDQMAGWAVRKLIARASLIGSLKPDHHLLPTDRARHTRADDPLHGERGFDPCHPQSSWEWEWKEFKKAAGISCRFHDLRHTYISRAAEAGVPVAVVQAQVGHMSAEMVRWYTHISEGALHKAAKQIEAQNPELVQILVGKQPDALAQPDAPVSTIDVRETRRHTRCRGWGRTTSQGVSLTASVRGC